MAHGPNLAIVEMDSERPGRTRLRRAVGIGTGGEHEPRRRTLGLSATGWLGVALGLLGAVLLFLGWWGVSGEPAVALQLPYLASASIPGAALVIAGAALLSGESTRRNTSDSERMIATLFDLLTVGSSPPSEPSDPESTPSLLMVPGGNRYHRAGCLLLEGKRGVTAVDSAEILHHELRPCPICNPVEIDH